MYRKPVINEAKVRKIVEETLKTFLKESYPYNEYDYDDDDYTSFVESQKKEMVSYVYYSPESNDLSPNGVNGHDYVELKVIPEFDDSDMDEDSFSLIDIYWEWENREDEEEYGIYEGEIERLFNKKKGMIADYLTNHSPYTIRNYVTK